MLRLFSSIVLDKSLDLFDNTNAQCQFLPLGPPICFGMAMYELGVPD